MTPAETLLADWNLPPDFWRAYRDHYYPLCPGCGERIPPTSQLPPAERVVYDGQLSPNGHLSVCPKSKP